MRPVWLSRNFGQHAATLAGIAASGGEWVVTMDEDGQHDPERHRRAARHRHDRAGRRRLRPPDQRAAARRPAQHRLPGRQVARPPARQGRPAGAFYSYRLVLGEVARSVAAYAGPGIYLDVAISWVASRIATCPVEMRSEGDRPSGYTCAACCPTSGGSCSPAAPGPCAGSAPWVPRPCSSPRSSPLALIIGRALGSLGGARAGPRR